jgi:RHS repeat-associated protein
MSRRLLLLILAVLACNGPAFAQSCPPGASWCSGTYAYDAMGNIRAIGADTYVYDTAGRLVSGTADVQRTGIMSRQDYAYDAFGNRIGASRIAGSVDCLVGCELSPAIDATTNHLAISSGAQYDDAGNLKSIPGTPNASYTYDAAGSLVQAIAGSDNRQFIYTADDERLATANGASWTWTVRGFDGKVLREFTSLQPPNGLPTSSWQWSKDYVWRDGLLLASVTPATSGGTSTQHFHLDHLGTPRLVTGNNGVQLAVHTYYPFGAELNLTPSEQPAELMKFTGHERDLLANDPHLLDYMHARFYAPNVGRFLSADLATGNSRAPQSWNLFSYAGANPVKNIDPDGRCSFTLTNGESYTDDSPVCAESTAKQPSDLEHEMTMANLAAVENLHYFGMFLDWVARDLSTPFLKFSQGILADDPLPVGGAVMGAGLIAAGGIGGPEEEAINVLNENLLHVVERHTVLGGAMTATKSVFAPGENIVTLIKGAAKVTPQVAGRRLVFVVNAGRTIGYDVATKAPTATYTVYTDLARNLITAHPGLP